MKMRKIIALLLSFCIMLSFSGCNNSNDPDKDTPSAVVDSTPPAQKVLNEILTAEEQEEYSLKIDAVEYSPRHGSLYIPDPMGNQPTYHSMKSSIDQVVEIGIKGLPVLLQKIHDKPDEEIFQGSSETPIPAVGNNLARHWLFTALQMLRIPYWDVSTTLNKNCLQKPSIMLNQAFVYAYDELEKTYNSDKTAEEKLIEYTSFGLLSIPYVMKELDAGNTKYELFFVLIGAHLSASDFAKLASSLSAYRSFRIVLESAKDPSIIEDFEVSAWLTEVYEKYPYDKWFEIYEEDFATVKLFDYKKWLSENEEELNALYKYLDAYMAENATASPEGQVDP